MSSTAQDGGPAFPRPDVMTTAVTRIESEAEAARVLIANLNDVLADEEDDALALGMIEGETGLLEAIDGGIALVQELEHSVVAIAERIKILRSRAARAERQAERTRSALQAAMEQARLTRLDRPEATLSVRPTAPKAIVTAEADIPSRFWKAPDPVLDKRELLAALKNGETIPGAALSNGGTTLQMRTG